METKTYIHKGMAQSYCTNSKIVQSMKIRKQFYFSVLKFIDFDFFQEFLFDK